MDVFDPRRIGLRYDKAGLVTECERRYISLGALLELRHGMERSLQPLLEHEWSDGGD